jgi:hypothetical protein
MPSATSAIAGSLMEMDDYTQERLAVKADQGIGGGQVAGVFGL